MPKPKPLPRRCAYQKCRKWAMKGKRWCSAHRDGDRRYYGGGGAPPGNQNARTHGLYAQYISRTAVAEAMDLPPSDLRAEIAIARAVLADLLETDLTAHERLEGLDRATAALVRLLRARHFLADGGDDASKKAAIIETLERLDREASNDESSLHPSLQQ